MLFIFDPNCGGYLCHSTRGVFNKIMFPQLIDSLIDNMYKRTARHGHCRVKRIYQPNNPKYWSRFHPVVSHVNESKYVRDRDGIS